MTHRVARMMAVAFIGISAGVVKAEGITFSSDSVQAHSYTGIGTFSGSVNVTGSGNAYTISLTLVNTTDLSHGGYITGFLLNNPGNIVSVNNPSSPNVAHWDQNNFNLLGFGPNYLTNNGLSGTLLGDFDFGASIYSSWYTDGIVDPSLLSGSGGIAAGGGSATFTFSVTTNGTPLTADDLFRPTNLSVNGLLSNSSDTIPYTPLGVRFLGLDSVRRDFFGIPYNTYSTDKVPLGTTAPTAAVPAPPAVVLGMMGAMGLFGRRAWSRRRTAQLAV